MTELTFVVRGLPVAQGTARAFVAGGKARIATDSNRTNSPIGAWRASIATEARMAMGRQVAFDGPVTVTAHFVFPRPRSHYLPANARRPRPELRLDAPKFVTAKPDVDKLARALLDAITNVVIADDSRVAGITAWKQYEDEERRPGVVVRIAPLRRTR
jgi:crossover junction endodeoxyribonuclease RusA